MKASKFICSSILLTGLIGCASSSGVIPIGKDTLSLSVQAATAASAKQDALTEASSHCKKINKTMEVTLMRPSSDAYGWHSYEVNFKCL